MSAKDHTEDMGSKGKEGHSGSDHSSPHVRMQRYIYKLYSSAENLNYIGFKNGLECILSLFIDDDVKDRGNRKNMQNPSLVYFGSFSGPMKGKYKGI
jgi:uncharacterized protein YkwD